MGSKLFKDERGRLWVVTKIGSQLSVDGSKDDNELLYEIAASCARELGVSEIKPGIPLEYINEHRRIWNFIWRSGLDLDEALPARR